MLMAVEAFRFCLYCVPFQRHPCCVNQPKALAKVTTSNILVNRIARPLEWRKLYAEGETLLEGDVEGTLREMSCHDFCLFVHLVKS
jgi:hypothetical protein